MNGKQKNELLESLKATLASLAGQDLSDVDPRATFFELGFDSLLLTQAVATLKNRFRVKITFRQLLEDLTTLESLAAYIDQQMPGQTVRSAPAAPCVPAVPCKVTAKSEAPGSL